ncbi:hypothetical protein TEA_010241 [Camellia sinensis var. sinensis]|uniref:Cation/H+ exchanger transmembrane domain-containing protein n=1 Tax=Camellia sinensis var. sinensis TaxID=542762 RepID=A0A4S4DF65_CAMSN|nr:hypothetical protein TEA_010241 [Camellia sinensis var. sinensis]
MLHNWKMAISLYRTMSLVKSHASSGQNLFVVIVRFLETFVGSMSAGVGAFGVAEKGGGGIHSGGGWSGMGWGVVRDQSGKGPKYSTTRYSLQNLECCLFVLFPYFSYMLAEGLGLSGIVSILFTGIVMKHYTFSNLSDNSQRFVSAFFHLISSLAETFVFIYMGFDIAMEQHSWSHVGFIFFSILFIGVARAVNVFSCAYLVNLVRPAHRQIPVKHQKALWYSGLRGAMAFALALQSVHDLPEGHGQTIFTATTAIVVLTLSKMDMDGVMAHGIIWGVTIVFPNSRNTLKLNLDGVLAHGIIWGVTIVFPNSQNTSKLNLMVFQIKFLSQLWSLDLNLNLKIQIHNHHYRFDPCLSKDSRVEIATIGSICTCELILEVQFGLVLLIGGSTGTMLEALQVVGDNHDGPLAESFEGNNGYIAPSYDGDTSSGNRFKMKLKEFHKSTASFTALDRNYLTPFFTTQSGDEEELGCNWVGGVITSCMKRGGDQSGSGSACWVRCTCGEYGEMYGVSCGGVTEVEGPAVAGAELEGTDVDGTDVSGAAAAVCTP